MMFSILVFSRHLCQLIALIAINGKTQSKGDCDNDALGINNECCTNYVMVDGICKACTPGYFGRNCSVLCPYPSYGLTCGDQCECDISICSHVFGCRTTETNMISDITMLRKNTDFFTRYHTSEIKDGTAYLMDRYRTTSTKSAVSPPSPELHTTTVIAAVGGILSLFLLIIIINQIQARVGKRRKARHSIKTRNEQQHENISDDYYEIDENEISIGPRYEHIVTHEPLMLQNKDNAGHFVEMPPDHPWLSVSPLQNDATRSNYQDDGHEVSCSSNTSSNGSYMKPTDKSNDYAKVIDTKDGDILVCIDTSSESSLCHSLKNQDVEGEKLSAEDSRNDNTYLDVISGMI